MAQEQRDTERKTILGGGTGGGGGGDQYQNSYRTLVEEKSSQGKRCGVASYLQAIERLFVTFTAKPAREHWHASQARALCMCLDSSQRLAHPMHVGGSSGTRWMAAPCGRGGKAGQEKTSDV